MARSKKGARKGAARPRGLSKPIMYADLPEMEWIAIVRDEIVAHAPTFKELRQIVSLRPDHATVVFSRVFPRRPQAW